MKTTFKFTTLTDHVGADCETCGYHYGSGKIVSVNDVVVWEQSSDGHYSGFQTEGTLVSNVLEAWSSLLLEEWYAASSEGARLEWNKKYAGNAVARTPIDWSEYHHENLEYANEAIESVENRCIKGMPYSEHLQLQLIAIWIEDCTGQEVEIIWAEEEM